MYCSPCQQGIPREGQVMDQIREQFEEFKMRFERQLLDIEQQNLSGEAQVEEIANFRRVTQHLYEDVDEVLRMEMRKHSMD